LEDYAEIDTQGGVPIADRLFPSFRATQSKSPHPLPQWIKTERIKGGPHEIDWFCPIDWKSTRHPEVARSVVA
jgi:hypothetical protein